jgi:fluoride ion exporter CrcB/FEX
MASSTEISINLSGTKEKVDCGTEDHKSESAGRKRCCYRQKGSLYEHVVYFCSLAVASYIGVLLRTYLTKLVKWDGVPLFPSIYPQLVGTAIMGFMTSHKELLAGSFLYTAIATGLCGSITTFSSWNSDAVSSLLLPLPQDNAGVMIFSWATTMILGLGMIAAALTFGRHLAMISPWTDTKLQNRPTNRCHILEGCFFICMWFVLTALVIASPWLLDRRDLMFSGLLASVGTYFRWHLSPLNSVFQKFKLGTFLANILGSWLLGGVLYAQDLYSDRIWVRDILVGVADGLCSSLTTVSSFAVELSDLPTSASYMYSVISIATAQVGMILIWGTLRWTSN